LRHREKERIAKRSSMSALHDLEKELRQSRRNALAHAVDKVRHNDELHRLEMRTRANVAAGIIGDASQR
jgi:hypothetical protein